MLRGSFENTAVRLSTTLFYRTASHTAHRMRSADTILSPGKPKNPASIFFMLSRRTLCTELPDLLSVAYWDSPSWMSHMSMTATGHDVSRSESEARQSPVSGSPVPLEEPRRSE